MCGWLKQNLTFSCFWLKDIRTRNFWQLIIEMFHLVAFAEQLFLHSALVGKIWYCVVYVFRFVGALTVAEMVYDDEQSAFKCSTRAVGCKTACYDQFAKMSHLRFWSFQLLALNIPVVLFHMYALHEKQKFEALAAHHEETDKHSPRKKRCRWIAEASKVSNRRRRTSNNVHLKRSLRRLRTSTEAGFRNTTLTWKTRKVHFVTSVMKVGIDAMFLCFAYMLFAINDSGVRPDGLDFVLLIWPQVPRFYRCSGTDLHFACKQHLLGGEQSFIPCWVSRPWEKTVCLRYMNAMTLISIALACVECMHYLVASCRKTKYRFDIENEVGRDYWESVYGFKQGTASSALKRQQICRPLETLKEKYRNKGVKSYKGVHV